MRSGVTATKILWGQISVVFLIVLGTIWTATQWTAWRLGFQPQLGQPWLELFGIPVYVPPAFFWWWYHYDTYATAIFVEGGVIAASGGFASRYVDRAFRVTRSRTRRPYNDGIVTADVEMLDELLLTGNKLRTLCYMLFSLSKVRSKHGPVHCSR